MFDSNRVFQLWSYTPTLSRLLLRSNKTAEFTTRVDIMFYRVAAVSLPSQMVGIRIFVVAPTSDLLSLRSEIPRGLLALAVQGDGYRGFIVARSLETHEDDLDYGERSVLATGPWLGP